MNTEKKSQDFENLINLGEKKKQTRTDILLLVKKEDMIHHDADG